MAWLMLIVAGAFEVGWAVGLKYTRGFTLLWPSLGTGAAMILSFLLLAQAVKTLPGRRPGRSHLRRQWRVSFGKSKSENDAPSTVGGRR